MKRDPYYPTKENWSDGFDMLCRFCANITRCTITESMIETMSGGPWPDGGWATDPGAGITCLSYQTKSRHPLSPDDLTETMAKAAPMCDGCAAQKGSEASVSLHTRRDFRKAVNTPFVFYCHAEGQEGKPCGGWCQAVKARI